MEWKTVRLGNYISIKSGLAYKGSKLGHGDSILLGMGCVSFKDKFVMTGARPYNDVVDDRFCVVPGDIVLATRQQSDNLPILAMPAIIPPSFEGKRVIFGTNLYKVDNHSEISNRFLFWLLKHQHYVNYIAGVKSGTAVQMVTKKNVEDYKFLCPPKNEREKIADILWTYDSQIENNKKRIKLLEQMAENLYKEWFVRFRFPGYETVEFEGEVPKGWLFEKLNDFGIILETGSRPKGGIDTSVENGIPSLGAEAINGLAEFDYYNLKLVSLDYYNSMKRGKSKGNHILVYKDGAYIGKVTLFRNAFPFNRYSINEHVFFLNTRDVNYQNYLYFTLHQPAFFTMMQNLNRNAAQPGLSQQDMFGIKVFKPTINVVTAFNSFVDTILDEVFNLAKENRLLATQRDLLLPRLMSGKLSI